MSDRLNHLYQSVILAHSQKPVHFFQHAEAQQTVEAYNPFCGDQFQLFFDLEGSTFQNLSFHGYGCSISKASTSCLVEWLDGKTIEQFSELWDSFQKVVQHGAIDDFPASYPQNLLAFAAAHKFPGRQGCATLSWGALSEQVGKGF